MEMHRVDRQSQNFMTSALHPFMVFIHDSAGPLWTRGDIVPIEVLAGDRSAAGRLALNQYRVGYARPGSNPEVRLAIRVSRDGSLG